MPECSTISILLYKLKNINKIGNINADAKIDVSNTNSLFFSTVFGAKNIAHNTKRIIAKNKSEFPTIKFLK